MVYLHLTLAAVFSSIYLAKGDGKCNASCPVTGQSMVCGFDASKTIYKMFPSRCALSAYNECNKETTLVETPLGYCIKSHNRRLLSRKLYGESCPTFCASHWRPVCGASVIRHYAYRTFNNGCFLDMLNCRTEDDDSYEEVPLEFCQKHMMKNMFREQVIVTGIHDYRDYY